MTKEDIAKEINTHRLAEAKRMYEQMNVYMHKDAIEVIAIELLRLVRK